VDLNLAGKTALITGASRGIGASIAQELAREGVRVCLAARDTAKLDEVARSIAAISGSNRTAVIAGDLRRPEAAQAAVDAAVLAFGKLDIVVNNAGTTATCERRAPRGRICAKPMAASSTSSASAPVLVRPSSPSVARSMSRC
jgi:NAD(P)-dependent dehydrogenase (short-subunit alcohol dehydrogenase family)